MLFTPLHYIYIYYTIYNKVVYHMASVEMLQNNTLIAFFCHDKNSTYLT